jgi:5-methylcytosine-specific restriction endonuclease McrA
MSEILFLDSLQLTRGAWDAKVVDRIASMAVPDGILGHRKSLLRCDIYRQWARWFIEGLADSAAFDPASVDYITVFVAVRAAVDQRFKDTLTPPSRHELASIAARTLYASIDERREEQRRARLGRGERVLLLELAGAPPRCGICGTAFSDQSIDAFVELQCPPDGKKALIDVLRPSGLSGRDLRIEVDHLIPFSVGGGETDNLRLTCGWCNAAKSANESLYDVNGTVRRVQRNALGITSLPRPFWVVRVLGTVGRCESETMCHATARNSELTVVPALASGALNPTNLRVTCLEHDPLRHLRLQPPSVVKKLWGR